MTLTPDRLADLDAFLIGLHAASAEVILPLFRADHALEDKGGASGFDPVTAADRGAEAAIRRLIAQRYPEHGVLGEEYGADRADAEFVWVLDPVDGTRSFIAGSPLWTTLIGLRVAGQPVLGSIGQPYLGELYIGGPEGSRLQWRGGTRPLKVRDCPLLTQATIGATEPDGYFNPAELGAWRQVRAAARVCRLGGDGYLFAMVALGSMDMVIESGLKPWDIEPVIPVITGAGGLVTDWRGGPVAADAGQVVVAGDRRCLDEALVALRRSAA